VKEIQALDECKKRASKYVPSTFQIAHIAAILANGKGSATDIPLVVAHEALKLWEACDSVKRARIHELAKGIREIEITLSKSNNLVQVEQINFKVPKKYPVDLDDFLRFALPKKRSADRMKLYRENMHSQIKGQKTA
jgi:hypothetical protein